MKHAYAINEQVKSLRDEKIVGPIIGYGTIYWDQDTQPVLVYLVQSRAEGSSPLGPAIAVLRADQVKGRWEE